MAVDTRNRRASALGVLLPLVLFPAPDGDLDTVPDRRHMVGLYAVDLNPITVFSWTGTPTFTAHYGTYFTAQYEAVLRLP